MYYGDMVLAVNILACHAGVTGSNPVRSTNGSVVQSGEYMPVTHEVAGSKPARVANMPE